MKLSPFSNCDLNHCSVPRATVVNLHVLSDDITPQVFLELRTVLLLLFSLPVLHLFKDMLLLKKDTEAERKKT